MTEIVRKLQAKRDAAYAGGGLKRIKRNIRRAN